MWCFKEISRSTVMDFALAELQFTGYCPLSLIHVPFSRNPVFSKNLPVKLTSQNQMKSFLNKVQVVL